MSRKAFFAIFMPARKYLMLTLSTIIICATAALTGGFIDAIAGGGGLLTVPALLLSGLPPHMVLGTNKLGAVLGTTVALLNFTRHKLVKWRLAAWGIGFSLLGSWLGSLLALHLEPAILAKILVILLPVGMVATLIPGQRKEKVPEIEIKGIYFWLFLPIICLAIGMYDGFFGPATGSFLIIALHWLLRLDLLEASGTAKAFNLASNLSGAVSFIWHGAVLWELGLIMAACLMLGNWLGSSFAIHIGAKAVKRFLFIALALLLVSLVWQQFIAPFMQ